jgi:aspartate aminotransferase-like enzyme
MGEVNRYHVLTTLNAILSSLSDFGLKVENEEIIKNARRALEAI